MKKALIGSFVGAIILFGWQALSWTTLHVHDKGVKYTPAQDALLQTISSTLKSEGTYYVPMADPSLSQEEKMKYQEQMNGKPWAIVTYHSTMNTDMVLPIVRGFLISFISVLLACLVLRRFDPAYKNFLSVFTSVLTFGAICFIYVWYNQHNWFQTGWDVLWGEMIDDLVSWGLCGLWLGWLYSRKNPKLTM